MASRRSGLQRWKTCAAAVRGLLAGRPVPLFASLEVTRRCSRSCRYCASPGGTLGPEVPLAGWVAILDDLAHSGALGISITGGEPLERPDVMAICDQARALGLYVGLNTNGIALPERRQVLSRVDHITLSLDGPPAVNDSIRGAGAFQAVYDAIRLAREAGVPVSITAVLSVRSVVALDEFLSWVAEQRIPVLFQPAYEHLLRSNGLPDPERLDDRAMRAALERILAAKEAGVLVQNSRAALRQMLVGDGPPRCQGGRTFVRVTASGEIQVCGLPGDTSPPGIRASEGIVEGMRRIRDARNRCQRCESAVRAEMNLLAAPSLEAWWERLVLALRKGSL